LQTFFLHYIILGNFTCIFTYRIFIFRRLDHFNFDKKMQFWNGGKN
jgi:hypothetical protein